MSRCLSCHAVHIPHRFQPFPGVWLPSPQACLLLDFLPPDCSAHTLHPISLDSHSSLYISGSDFEPPSSVYQQNSLSIPQQDEGLLIEWEGRGADKFCQLIQSWTKQLRYCCIEKRLLEQCYVNEIHTHTTRLMPLGLSWNFTPVVCTGKNFTPFD